MNLLHIDSSILGVHSVSRKLSAEIVAKLKAQAPGLVEVRRDLGEEAVPHMTGAYLQAVQSPGGAHAPAVQADLAISGTVLQEFIAADVVVIGVAFYNFTVSSQLKAWVDRILIPGVAFRYGAEGQPEGLMGGKRVILAVARGGVYAPDSPAAAYEHAETYLRTVFGFIGVTDVEVVAADGLRRGPEVRAAALAAAEQHIAALAA